MTQEGGVYSKKPKDLLNKFNIDLNQLYGLAAEKNLIAFWLLSFSLFPFDTILN